MMQPNQPSSFAQFFHFLRFKRVLIDLCFTIHEWNRLPVRLLACAANSTQFEPHHACDGWRWGQAFVCYYHRKKCAAIIFMLLLCVYALRMPEKVKKTKTADILHKFLFWRFFAFFFGWLLRHAHNNSAKMGWTTFSWLWLQHKRTAIQTMRLGSTTAPTMSIAVWPWDNSFLWKKTWILFTSMRFEFIECILLIFVFTSA